MCNNDVGDHKTRKDGAKAAFGEYTKRRERLRILDVFGQFDFDPAYDYKAERRRRRKKALGLKLYLVR